MDNISEGYTDAIFIVGEQGDRIVGTGVLVPKSTDTAEIVQVSVSSDVCWSSVSIVILQGLCEEGRQLGFSRLLVETTTVSKDVIALYKRFGFHTNYQDGDTSVSNMCFVLDLA